MENRKDQSGVLRQHQQGQPTQSGGASAASQQQQASQPYEPKLVRDPKTGDYYDQNQQSRAGVQQQAANPAGSPQQGEYKRKQSHSKMPQSSAQQGSAQSKSQTK